MTKQISFVSNRIELLMQEEEGTFKEVFMSLFLLCLEDLAN